MSLTHQKICGVPVAEFHLNRRDMSPALERCIGRLIPLLLIKQAMDLTSADPPNDNHLFGKVDPAIFLSAMCISGDVIQAFQVLGLNIEANASLLDIDSAVLAAVVAEAKTYFNEICGFSADEGAYRLGYQKVHRLVGLKDAFLSRGSIGLIFASEEMVRADGSLGAPRDDAYVFSSHRMKFVPGSAFKTKGELKALYRSVKSMQ